MINDETKEMESFRAIVKKYCLDDPLAVKLCEDYLQVAHIWDDLFDRDKDLTTMQINRAFCNALGMIPTNPIYQENVQAMAALSLLTALTWQIANKFEHDGNEDEKLGAFILRNGLMQLIYFIMLITGARNGDETFMVDMGEYFFREMFKGYHKKYLVFLEEMKK